VTLVKGDGYFQSFTTWQIGAAQSIFAALRERYPQIRSLYHGDLTPDDREDPGPLFPRERFA